MNKILIITYYWPPSGGAGVQRWLKLSKYLALNGIEVHIITVDSQQASYMQQDHSLCSDVHPSINIHQTDTFEPINYYARVVGKSNVPIAGFSNVNNSSWKQKSINFIRSNFFIPDPRRGWNKYAYRKAIEVIKQYDIKYVITTSPPHSTQLVGLRLKKTLKTSIKWIVDFRDPWTDIYYYNILQHTFLSHMINKKYEKTVIEQSDTIFTVGNHFKSVFLSKTDKISADKIVVIPNGYDALDFNNLESKKEDSSFTISYIGTISDYYKPEVFFRALAKLIDKYPAVSIKFKLVGVVSEKLKRFIVDQIGNAAWITPPVPHDEAIKYMINSDVLLLITQGEKGTIPGKTFEYLAAKRRIICIGKGDASTIISKCEAGKSFERGDEEGILLYLETSLNEFISKKAFDVNTTELIKYSRAYQANQVITYCK